MLVGVVDEAVEDGVGDGRLAQGLVPVADRELARDDGAPAPVAIVDQLEQAGRLPHPHLSVAGLGMRRVLLPAPYAWLIGAHKRPQATPPAPAEHLARIHR